jgi:rare lipoprotein A
VAESRTRSQISGVLGAALIAALLQAGCSSHTPSIPVERDGPGDGRDVSQIPDAVPRVEPRSRGGNAKSYVVFGKRYYTLDSSKGFVERGIASWYGSKFHGRKTSNGETYDMYAMSAAHTRLPIPTYLQVTNLENGRKIIVRVNDRGPFHDNRIIDLSYAAASRLGMLKKGTALVEIRALDPAAPRQPKVRMAGAEQPASPGGTPRIFLQAGAFSSDGNARRLQQRLADGLARPVRVVSAQTASGKVHRVQVGPLASVDIADQVSNHLHGYGIREPLVIID